MNLPTIVLQKPSLTSAITPVTYPLLPSGRGRGRGKSEGLEDARPGAGPHGEAGGGLGPVPATHRVIMSYSKTRNAVYKLG